MTLTHNGFTFSSLDDGLIRMIERNLLNGRLNVTVEIKALTEAGGTHVVQHSCKCVREAEKTVETYGSEATQ